MNILVTSAHYHLSDKYGSEALWGVEILNHYAKQGYKIFAIAGTLELTQELEQSVTLFNLTKGRSTNPLIEFIKKTIYPIFSFFQALKIYKKLNGNFDIVHHIAPTGRVSYDLFFILRPKNLKAKFLLGPAMIPAVETHHKSFARVLGSSQSIVVSPLWLMFKLTTPLLHLLFKLTIRKADYLIAVTNEAKSYYSKFISPKKIIVVPVGVNSDKFVKSKEETKKGVLVILSVAYLTYRKGVDLLIKAAENLYNQRKLQNFKVVIVGTGDEEKKLKRLGKRLKISEIIEFAGFVPNDKVPEFYKTSDIFCSPTRHEPYGLTLIEAMASGLPVVATNVNSVKELVGEAGLFFSKDNVEELSDNLFSLLTNARLRKQLGKKALNRADNLYSWDKIVTQYTRYET